MTPMTLFRPVSVVALVLLSALLWRRNIQPQNKAIGLRMISDFTLAR